MANLVYFQTQNLLTLPVLFENLLLIVRIPGAFDPVTVAPKSKYLSICVCFAQANRDHQQRWRGYMNSYLQEFAKFAERIDSLVIAIGSFPGNFNLHPRRVLQLVSGKRLKFRELLSAAAAAAPPLSGSVGGGSSSRTDVCERSVRSQPMEVRRRVG